MAFTYYRKLTFDRTKCGPSNVANFPALVSIADSGFGSRVSSTSGFDVVFANDPAGASLVPWEVEPGFDKATGKMIAHVKLAALNGSAAGANSSLYMCYGDPSIVAAKNVGANAPTNVWASRHKGVWHFANTGSLVITDSTGINACATSGTPTGGTSGQIGGSMISTAGAKITTTANASQNITGDLTIMFWLRLVNPGLTTGYQSLISKRDINSGPSTYSIETNPNAVLSNRMYLWITIGGSFTGFTSDNAHQYSANWDHWAIVRDGVAKTVKMYKNGQDAGATLAFGTYNAAADSTTTGVTIGCFTYDTNGAAKEMDEVRILNTVMTPDEVLATYNSQFAPGNIGANGFVIFGPESRAQQQSVGIV